MINGKLQEFVCSVIAKGQMSFGDVRRLQRGCLPSGITNSEELEMLISLNVKVVRADKAWAQWLIAAIADFFAAGKASESPIDDAVGKRVERLLAASNTNLSRRIARQIRHELARLQTTQAPKNDLDDRSLRRSEPQYYEPYQSRAWSRSPHHPVRYEIPKAMTIASAAHFGCLASYVPALQLAA